MKNSIGKTATAAAIWLALSAQVEAKEMGWVDSVNLTEDGKNTISMNNPLIVRETRDYTKEAVKLSLEELKINVNEEIANNEPLQEILEWLKLDESTKLKVLGLLSQVVSWKTLWAITSNEETWWGIEIYREWENVTITFSSTNDFWKDKSLELKLEDPKNSNAPVKVSAQWVSFDYMTESWAVLKTWININELVWDSARLAWAVSMEQISLWLLVDLWPDMYRIIASIGFEVWTNGQLIFLWEHLSQDQEISTQIMWVLEEQITQNKLWFEYKQKISDWFFNYLVFSWYISASDGKELLNRQITIEDADYINVYRQMVSLEWTTTVWVSWWMWLKLNENNKIELLLNAEYRDYDASWSETWFWVRTRYTTESFIWDLINGSEVFLEWWLWNDSTWNMYGAWLSVPVWDNGKFSLTWRHTEWQWDQKSDNTIMASYTQSFWAAKWLSDPSEMTGWYEWRQNVAWTTKQITSDMMNSMEDIATVGLISARVQEKTELISSTRKVQPAAAPAAAPTAAPTQEETETPETPEVIAPATSISFLWPTPSKKNTAYYNFFIKADKTIKPWATLTASAWTLNYTISWDTITIISWSWTNAAWVTFTLTQPASPDVTLYQPLEDLDTIAPSKTWESFPDLTFKWLPFSWTMSFDEDIAVVTSIDISWISWSVSVDSWIWTSTLNISWITPGDVDNVEITLTVEDSTWNSRTITSNNYVVI